MAPRGRQPKYDTEEERAAAKQAQGAKRQREFRARGKAKQENDISTATSEEASRVGHVTKSNLGEVEPASPVTDDLTIERPANNENPRESGTNLLYWATVLEDPTSRPPEKPVVSRVVNWRTFVPCNPA
jgi:hypothetical protein